MSFEPTSRLYIWARETYRFVDLPSQVLPELTEAYRFLSILACGAHSMADGTRSQDFLQSFGETARALQYMIRIAETLRAKVGPAWTMFRKDTLVEHMGRAYPDPLAASIDSAKAVLDRLAGCFGETLAWTECNEKLFCQSLQQEPASIEKLSKAIRIAFNLRSGFTVPHPSWLITLAYKEILEANSSASVRNEVATIPFAIADSRQDAQLDGLGQDMRIATRKAGLLKTSDASVAMFSDLEEVATKLLKGKARRIVELVCQNNGEYSIADLAMDAAIEWDEYVGSNEKCSSALFRINEKFRSFGTRWRMKRINNSVRAEQIQRRQ